MLNYNGVKKIWLKGIGLILLLIAINGVSMTSEENEIMMESKESQEEESSWDKAKREERRRMEKIKTMTKGKGTFSMVITNAGSGFEPIKVSIYMINPPLGYENLDHQSKEKRFLYSNVVDIIPNETMSLELPVPFISLQDNPEQYDNVDNLLPLPENSEIVIEIKNTRNTWAIIHLPEYKKVFKAKYLPGTRLLELPAEIPITVDYDRLIPEPNPGFGLTQESIDSINSILERLMSSPHK